MGDDGESDSQVINLIAVIQNPSPSPLFRLRLLYPTSKKLPETLKKTRKSMFLALMSYGEKTSWFDSGSKNMLQDELEIIICP